MEQDKADPSQKQPSQAAPSAGAGADQDLPLVDELGVEDLRELIFGKRGRLFSAAGRQAPVAEFTDDFLVLHPPQKPFAESGATEDIVSHVDDRGVLLNEVGAPRKIAGAKFKGRELWWLGERMPGTLRHYVGWFDDAGKSHKLYINGEAITTEVAYRMRNRTHDGELSIFPDITTDEGA